jgi:hypothetical protein
MKVENNLSNIILGLFAKSTHKTNPFTSSKGRENEPWMLSM